MSPFTTLTEGTTLKVRSETTLREEDRGVRWAACRHIEDMRFVALKELELEHELVEHYIKITNSAGKFLCAFRATETPQEMWERMFPQGR